MTPGSSVCIQVMSDLHLESGSGYDTFVIEPRAPYLALLGDIGNTRDDKLYKFFETQLRRFQKVFFLLGNHEPYYSSFPKSKEKSLPSKNHGMKRVFRILHLASSSSSIKSVMISTQTLPS